MSYVDIITSKENFRAHHSTLQTDPSIIRMMGPETFCMEGDPEHHLINIYTDGVDVPMVALALDSSGYNLGEQLSPGKDYAFCELLIDKGRLWVNPILVIDCIPAEAAPDGRIRTKLLFSEEKSTLILGSADEVKKALMNPVTPDFSPPQKTVIVNCPTTYAKRTTKNKKGQPAVLVS